MEVSKISNIVGTKSIAAYRKNAKLLKEQFDLMPQDFIFSSNLKKTKNLYKRFLNNEMENLTRSKLAKWEMYRTNFKNSNNVLEKYYNTLNKIPEIKNLKSKVSEKIRTLYPKTAETREVLAQENRVVFDKVQPALKGFDKFLLKVKMYI